MLRTLSRMAAATRIAVGASAASMILVTSVILVASAGPATATAQAPGRAAAPASVQSVVVSTLSDGGAGSLRAAIATANASAPGTTTNISFSVSGTITLASALPAISGQVVIDGTSAPGYVSGGGPVVEVDCNNWAGLRFATGSDGSQLLGLAVDNASGNGVTIGANSVTLNHNYIGLNMNGTAAGNRGAGVSVLPGSSGNVIGRNPSGDSGAVANVISGNAGSGIVLAGSSGNTVAANRIGTDPSGQSSIANGGNGIWLTAGADRNEIGGTAYVDQATGQTNNPTGSKGTVTPVFVVPPDGNLISGNAANGVLIDRMSSGNSLNGNFVGTTADGDGGLGNGGNGVWIDGAGNNSLTGCKFVNNPFVYYNVLSGNDQNGLRITNSNNVTVQGNFLGVGANNTTLLGNRLDGIRVEGTSANTQVGGVIPLGNVSSGNGRNGIAVTGRVHGFVTFNTFGGLLAFKGAAPNGNDGLLITSSRGGNLVRTNVFSGNRRNGIELAGHEYGVTDRPQHRRAEHQGQRAAGQRRRRRPHRRRRARQQARGHAEVGDPAEHVLREQGLRPGHRRPRAREPGRADLHRDQDSRRGGARQPQGRDPAGRPVLLQLHRQQAPAAVQPDQRQPRQRRDAAPGRARDPGDQQLHRPQPVRPVPAEHPPRAGQPGPCDPHRRQPLQLRPAPEPGEPAAVGTVPVALHPRRRPAPAGPLTA